MASPQCFRIGIFLLFSLAIRAAPGSALDLELADIEVEDGGKVRFEKTDCEPLEQLPFSRTDDNVYHVPLIRYDVYYRIEDIVPRKFLRFVRYRFYVKLKSGGAVMECDIPGKPTGSFRPQLADVNLYVGEGGEGRDSTTIKLPILSLTPYGYLTYSPWTEPEKVEIGGETEIAVQLENRLTGWPVRIDAVSQPNRKSLWRQAEFLAKDQKKFAPFDVPAGLSKDRLVVKLEPNSGQALLKSLFSPNVKGDPEKVMASLEYRVQLGLRGNLESETLPIEIPVRFVPYPLLLITALFVGTVLGSLIPLATGQRRKADLLPAWVASLLTAFLAWLVAILLVQNNSEFRLLGFALDPFQLLPTALIGALLGLLGFKSLDAVKKLIPGFGTGQRAAEEKK